MKSTSKRLLALLLICTIAVFATACGADTKESGEKQNEPTAAPAESAEQQDAASGEESGEEPEETSGGESDGKPESVTFYTGPSGGNWYSMGAVFSDVLMNAGTDASFVAGGGTQNVIAVGDGEADIALCNLFGMIDAYQGNDPYTREYTDVVTLMGLETNLIYLIVPVDSDITCVNDLRGKTVAVSSVGSTAYTMAMDILKCAGIDQEKDLTIKAGSMSEGADMMKDRLADAFLIMTGRSNSTLMDIATSIDVRFCDIEESVRTAMLEMNPGYMEFTLPGGVYKGQDEDVLAVASKGAMICNANMSDEEAYWITKTIVENLDEIKAACAWLDELTIESMADTGNIEMHPGAVRYFSENK